MVITCRHVESSDQVSLFERLSNEIETLKINQDEPLQDPLNPDPA